MAFRIWLFIAALSSMLAVAAGAYGAHSLNGIVSFSSTVKIYETGQLYHMLHSIAILAVALLLAATEGRRKGWASAMLQIAAVAFLAGIALFSGGIYYHVLMELQTGTQIVPAGGVIFLIGWAALALSVFGFRTAAAGAGAE